MVPDNNETYTFAVTISNDRDVVLTSNRTIDRLDCYGDGVDIEIWTPNYVEFTLVDPCGLTNHGGLEIKAGPGREFKGVGLLEINGNVRNLAGASLALAGVKIDGQLSNHADADEVWIQHKVFLASDFENQSLLLIYKTGNLWADLDVYNTGTIQLYGGRFLIDDSTLYNDANGIIKGFGVIKTDSDQLLQNKGAIYASGGLLAIRNSPLLNTGVLCNMPGALLHIKPAEDVNNNGTIEVNAGGGVTFDCNLINEPNNLLSEPNGVIKLLGGNLAATTITQKAGANFVGFGGITGDVVIEPNGLIELTGPTNIVGDVTIDPNATLEISDGTTLVTGDCACNNGTIHMIGGRIIIQGTFTNDNCNIIWQPGTYTNAADFNLDGTVNNKDFAAIAGTWLWQAAWY
jgi:hypothetical protein